MGKRSYDWEAIERDYRTGRYSLQQLTDMHGPAKQTISDRVKREGWEKDLSGPVRQRTREKVIRSTLTDEALEALAGDDRAIVEEAANLNAAVVSGHRRTLTQWQGIAARFADRIEAQLDQGKISVQLRDGGVTEIDIPLDYIAKSMSAGTQAVERIVKLERQSYGLDDESDEQPAEAHLTDKQVRERIAELEARRQGQA